MPPSTPSHSAHLVRHAVPQNCRAASLVTPHTDSTTGVGGNSIASIITKHCQCMPAPSTVIVEYLDTQIGTWQYSTDDAKSWHTIRTDLINRPGCTGLELGHTARLRVLPLRDSMRSAAARLVFHAAPRTLSEGNGSYRTYPPNDRGDGAESATIVLTLDDINGIPPKGYAPRPRNKRALAAQRRPN